MSLQSSITQVILEVGITTISELAKNVIYYILIIWGVNKISRQIPKLIEDYDKMKMKHYQINKAIEGRKL